MVDQERNDDSMTFGKAVAHISDKEPLYFKKQDIHIKKRLDGMDRFNENLKSNQANFSHAKNRPESLIKSQAPANPYVKNNNAFTRDRAANRSNSRETDPRERPVNVTN